MEKEIKELEEEKAEIEKEGNEKIRVLDREKKELKHELERKRLILEEKEKELRLNQMKHKEILRLINSALSSQRAPNESQVEKENKNEGKRKVSKQGREAPKMEGMEE